MKKALATSKLTKNQAMALCQQVRDGLGTVADALMELHENHGWLALGYATWKECCAKEFCHPTWWAKRQLQIAAVRKALPPPPPKSVSVQKAETSVQEGANLSPITPQKDSHLVELAKVPEEQRAAVLAWATEKADGKPLTAAAIRQAAKDFKGAEPPPEDAPAFDVTSEETDDDVETDPTAEEAMKEVNGKIESFCRQHQKWIEEHFPSDPWIEKDGRGNAALQKFKDGDATLRTCKCTGLCPKCSGDGCGSCLNTGRMTRYMLDQLGAKAA